jgi:hypothetical protein
MSFLLGSPGPDEAATARYEPVLPEQSREDTDANWGEYIVPDDDEQLRRDRPPHWDDY